MPQVISLMSVLLGGFYLRKISQSSTRMTKLIYFVIVYNLFIKFLIGNIGLPSLFNYLSDAIVLWMVLEFLYQKKYRLVPKSIRVCIGIFLFISIMSYMLNLYSPLLYAWGFRNNFRFLIFAMMCSVYLEKRDISTIMNILICFFFLNIVAVTYQRFFVSYSMGSAGDLISGLYSNGFDRGGNGALNWLICIVCAYVIVRYLYKQESIFFMMLVVTAAIYMAAAAEIKLFFLQLALIAILAVSFCKKSFRAAMFTSLVFVALYFGMEIMYYFYPTFAGFFKPETILGYATKQTGYSGGGLDRLTVVPFVLEHYLHNPLERMFGIGLGNADYSSNFSFLLSRFYQTYSNNNYVWFHTAFLLIELGFAGLISYVLIILNCARKAWSNRTTSVEEKAINNMTIILCVMAFMTIISSSVLRTDTAGFLGQCVLLFPFLLDKDADRSVSDAKVARSPIRIGMRRGRLVLIK